MIGSGLYANIHSADLVTTAEADGNLVFLKNDDFSGAFAQVSDAASTGDAWWNINGHIGSVISVAGNKKGKKETRLSFRDQFLNQWETFLDGKLAGSRASRQGEPTLTWEMFPVGISSLDPNHTYLKIYQPLHISMPWPFSDYAASMTYHIQLFVDGNHHLRAWGQRWAWWVESGIKSGHIGDSLGPQVQRRTADAGRSGQREDLGARRARCWLAMSTICREGSLPGSEPDSSPAIPTMM